ncbi:mannonate dehydratase [Allorhizobium taibaishanense]|uniref:Mannonate dehydratase n=1 Tax=Allorhizobium taibaishanense TaxID=887144 RepID=A0A1Q9A3U5_9HYPH|nr:mannonate dehydratase [Allorhizobium taibaishanense]MBB4006229.1 mannonate dehydratase [Allorhizobium taibaishanense]OLP49212.1 mannonate dehydratase [Allorhizobium taibaishanense]
MQECFRWYGSNDPVPLEHIRQAGATGIVTALHHIYDGSAWPEAEILEHKAKIEAAGLVWSVVESIPVHNSIKIGAPERERYIANYQQTIRALAKAGIRTVCYNFMPVVDWTRTDLMYPMPSTGLALRFDAVDFAAYDIFVLKREGAADDYVESRITEAEARFRSMDEAKALRIERNLIAGLPATERVYDRPAFREALAEYRGIDAATMRDNLFYFLRQIVPVAVECGVNLCIHPDDPPFSLFGLPRIVSTADDARAILSAVDNKENGLTFCTGSYGARPDNDLPAMVDEFASRIHFAHLRNVTLEGDGSFHEADHLDGSTDMEAVVIALTREEIRREQQGRPDATIPMRPDHGHLLADDIGKAKINPGYSLIGRLKGLAELRGAMRMARRFL